MKSSIIYFGIALTTFTNVALALNYQKSPLNEDLNQASTLQSVKNIEVSINEGHSRERAGGKENTANGPSDVVVFNPYEKTMAEIITEDNLIIENAISNDAGFSNQKSVAEESKSLDEIILAEVYPHYSEKTTEETITEDSKIIESLVVDAVQIKSNSRKCKKECTL